MLNNKLNAMLFLSLRKRLLAGGAIVYALWLFALPAVGADQAWNTNPTSGNFSSANWTTGTTAPGAGANTIAAGDNLYFGTSSLLNLTNDTALPFGGFTFNANANQFTIHGGASNFQFQGGITNNGNSSTFQTIFGNFQLQNDLVIASASGTTTWLYTTNAGVGGNSFSGIFGAHALIKNGPGVAALACEDVNYNIIDDGYNSYSGGTIINGGSLYVFGNTGAGYCMAGSGPITINPAGRLTLVYIDALGYAGSGHGSPTIITNNGGTLTDVGTNLVGSAGNYHLTLPDMTFIGGLMTNDPSNLGDVNLAQYVLRGDGTTAIITSLSNNSTAFLAPARIIGDFSSLPQIVFDIAAGNITGGRAPGVDMLVSAQMFFFANEAFFKNGAGVLSMTATFGLMSPLTINGGTLSLDGNGQFRNTTTGSYTFTNSILNFGTFIYNYSGTNLQQVLAGPISGPGTLIKNGPKFLKLAGTNTYTGSTLILGGTLALINNGSIAMSSNITIAAGATLDVSQLVPLFIFSTTNTLSAMGTTTNSAVITNALGNTVNLGSQPVNLTFTPTSFNGDLSHPALTVQQGQLFLINNPFTVTNAGASPLANAAYLIVTNVGQNVASTATFPLANVYGPGNVTAKGTISVTNGGIYLIVSNPPPVLAPVTIAATLGYSLKIPLANLLTNWSDPNGAAVALAGVNPASTNNVTLTTDSNYIYYHTNVMTATDQLSYTVTNSLGATATGVINIVPQNAAGQQAQISVAGSTATMSFAGIPGYTNYVQRSASLSPALWITIATNVAPTNGLFQFVDPSAPTGSAFYRLSTAP